MRGMFLLGTAVAASLLGTAPAIAKKKPKPVPVVVAPPVVIETEPVARFYQLRYYNPIWFREAGGGEAVTNVGCRASPRPDRRACQWAAACRRCRGGRRARPHR